MINVNAASFIVDENTLGFIGVVAWAAPARQLHLAPGVQNQTPESAACTRQLSQSTKQAGPILYVCC